MLNFRRHLFITFWLMLFGILGVVNAEESKNQNLWYKANELADRLNGERWKFVVVKEEVNRIKQVIEDLRAIQVYPGAITGINETSSNDIKEALSKINKDSEKAMAILADLEKPQEDAILISIEMLKESPNLDMIEILINDNIYRIKNLVVVKKYVDKQWDAVHSIMDKYWKLAGLPESKAEKGIIDDAFFKVLISQLGQASDVFYQKFHDYKDSLVVKTERKSWVHMASVDLESMQRAMKSRNPEAIQRDLQRLANRFSKRLPIGGVYYYLGLSFYNNGKFQKSLNIFEKVNAQSEYYVKSRQFILKSLFSLGKDDSLTVLFKQYEAKKLFTGFEMDKLRYLHIQSLYNLQKDAEVAKALIEFNEKNEFYYRAYLLFGKSLVRQLRDREASEVFKSIINKAQLPEAFRQKAQIHLGYLKYEQEYYESALADFKSLIDKKGVEAKAMYGMVWCYVKMKNMQAAEFTLKKLINQYPDSPLALDGLMVLSKWRFVKANKLWSYKLSTDKNKSKLQKYQNQIDAMIESGSIDEVMSDEVKRKLSMVQLNLSSRIPVDVNNIIALFREALDLVKYIPLHYKSGEYTEVTYSGSRELALEKMTNLLTPEAVKPVGGTSKNIKDVKDLDLKLYESQLLTLDMYIQFLNWIEKFSEYVEYKSLASDTSKNGKETKNYQENLGKLSESMFQICYHGLEVINELIKSPLIESQRDKVIFYKGFLYFKIEEKKKELLVKRTAYLGKQSVTNQSRLKSKEKFYSDIEFEKIWNFFLEEFPNSEYVPAVLYYLGYSKYLQGDDKGIAALQKFTTVYDSSEYAAHALTLIGDYYFETGDFVLAMDAYQRILDKPGSAYFDQALYKLAWAYYQSEDYEMALKAFTLILENLLNQLESDQDIVFIEEVLKMVAFSFAELDQKQGISDEKLKMFVDNFSNPILGATILHRTAYVFRKQGRLEKAKRVLLNLIQNYPDYVNMPEAMMDLSVTYDIENNVTKAQEIRSQVFDKFNRQSDWYQKLKHENHKAKADSICELSLTKIAEFYFSQAKMADIKHGELPPGSIVNKDMFMKAVTAYEKFLKIYPDSRNAHKFNYRLAESYFALQKYYKASVLYLKAALSNDTEIKTAASYNAIIAAEKYYELNK